MRRPVSSLNQFKKFKAGNWGALSRKELCSASGVIHAATDFWNWTLAWFTDAHACAETRTEWWRLERYHDRITIEPERGMDLRYV